MFNIKKLFNSARSGKTNENKKSCIESDAIPVDGNANVARENTICELQRSVSNNHFVEDASSVSPEDGFTNVNNVNQQVVVQFSNINGLQIGSTYNINNTINSTKDVEKPQNKSKCKYPKTITISEMMKSNNEPSREILNEIATHLGKDYKSFMRDLGFSDGQISAKNIDHNVYGVKEVIYQLLLDWLRNADDEGTVGYLTTKLWNSGHRECVYRLKVLWKANDMAKTNISVG